MDKILNAVNDTIEALNKYRGEDNAAGSFNYEFAKIRARFTGDLISLGVFTDAAHKAMSEENKKHTPTPTKTSDKDFLDSFNFKGVNK